MLTDMGANPLFILIWIDIKRDKHEGVQGPVPQLHDLLLLGRTNRAGNREGQDHDGFVPEIRNSEYLF